MNDKHRFSVTFPMFVWDWIRARASKHHRSISQEVIDILEKEKGSENH